MNKIKRKKEKPYTFVEWCRQYGWKPEKPTDNTRWVNGSSKLSLCQLQEVFKDWKEEHNDSD